MVKVNSKTRKNRKQKIKKTKNLSNPWQVIMTDHDILDQQRTFFVILDPSSAIFNA